MTDNFTFVSTRSPRDDVKVSPPKKAYDLEYSTQTRREFEFLKERGIDPTYIKISIYGVRTYKYTKTPALFTLLAEYYDKVKAEKEAKQNMTDDAPKKVQIYA